MTETLLYPKIAANRQGYLEVSSLHRLYWEESGNPAGKAVVFLHGGPGAGATASHRRFFDPAFYRIVVFDQRGAGRSEPLGEWQDNSTDHLVDDMEKLREMLGIERWLVFGGSWGSTLALAYAQSCPDRVAGLVLRGIFLGRQKEIDWFMTGMARIFPETWLRFAQAIPESERDDLLEAYGRRLFDPDPEIYRPAARAWSGYEGACATLLPSPETVAAFESDTMALGLARLECHYFRNRCFLEEGQLLANCHRISDIPGIIVQGRYDVICPFESAHDLAAAWPQARLKVVDDAGHSAMEPGIAAALVTACNDMKKAALWG